MIIGWGASAEAADMCSQNSKQKRLRSDRSLRIYAKEPTHYVDRLFQLPFRAPTRPAHIPCSIAVGAVEQGTVALVGGGKGKYGKRAAVNPAGVGQIHLKRVLEAATRSAGTERAWSDVYQGCPSRDAGSFVGESLLI